MGGRLDKENGGNDALATTKQNENSKSKKCLQCKQKHNFLESMRGF